MNGLIAFGSAEIDGDQGGSPVAMVLGALITLKGTGFDGTFIRFEKMYALVCIVSSLYLITARPLDVQINQNGDGNFMVGPGDRAQFTLLEDYRPLTQAFNRVDRAKIRASKQFQPKAQKIEVMVEFPTETQDLTPVEAPAAVTESLPEVGVWKEWSRWTPCSKGQRIRVRQCTGKTCEGLNKQSQTCFSTQQATPVANDPMVIEKEIQG
ncbi:unnamed protein product [Bursaphelenchus xylophilus]|uniref:(pine wood nematode) hypothetical protein n=1 Tax=Bursaphelenchus xylophilus TaxID=6326 RepID=A0A1I7RN69_BURXY|nr:unnamed protein product [Bursaphelenchus xylophilus]CAG9123704.1 unnamed protein product [Bursaphelenchus xylophilus]